MDLTAQRFGRWTAIKLHAERAPDRQAQWLCKCDCGTERFVKAGSLRSGLSASCGDCKHPLAPSVHPLWRRWYNMIQRCTNPGARGYENYGGRGIAVCKRWQAFENFASDMEPSFRPELMIDRIDNDKGYSPENCQWVTPTDSTRNRRVAVILKTPWGRLPLKEAAARTGVTVGCLYQRLLKRLPAEQLFRGPKSHRAARKNISSYRTTHTANSAPPASAGAGNASLNGTVSFRLLT